MADISSALAGFNVGKITVTANVSVLPGAIFSYHAPAYRDLGYSPVPGFESGKWPLEWSKYCHEAAPLDQIQRWGKVPNSNITLACGYGGLVVIDVDTSRKAILAAVLGALPHCPIGRFGSKGFALLCRHLDPEVASGDKRFRSICWADPAVIEPMVEVKASGQNIKVPPSIHKSGKPYAWIDPETGAPIIDPETGAVVLYPPALADLPVITDEYIERLRAALAQGAAKPREKARKGGAKASNRRAWRHGREAA